MDINSFTVGVPDYLREPALRLQTFGLFSNNKIRKYLQVTIYLLFLLHSFLMAIVLQFIHIKKDLLEFIFNCEALFSCMQPLANLIFLTYQENIFLKLFASTREFKIYKTEQNTDDVVLRNQVLRVQRILLVSALLSIVFMAVYSLTANVMPLGIWTLEGYEVLRRITSIEILLLLIPNITLCCLSSSMYLAFSTENIIQYRILCRNLNKIGAGGIDDEIEASYLNQIKTCIQHHQLILKYVEDFQYAFSFILLNEYCTISSILCLELLAMFEGSTVEDKILHGCLFFILLVRLCFYCIPANYIQTEAVLVADAVYFAKWYIRCHPSYKQTVTLIIQNAQNGITIKAGGMITINANTVVDVLKVGWTTCSLLKGLEQN